MSDNNTSSRASSRTATTDPRLKDITFDICTSRSSNGLHQFNENNKKLKFAVIQIVDCGQVAEIFERFRDHPMPEPVQRADEADFIFHEKAKKYVANLDKYQQAKMRAYHVIMSVCTSAMITHLEGTADFAVFDAAKDPIALLLHIQRLMSHEGARDEHKIKSLTVGLQNLSKLYQHPQTSDEEIYHRFIDMHQIIDRCGGGYGFFSESLINSEMTARFGRELTGTERMAEGMLSGAINAAHVTEQAMLQPEAIRVNVLVHMIVAMKNQVDRRQAAIEQLKEKTKAMDFILHRVNKDRYGKMVEELENALSMGEDKYPKTVAEAYRMVLNRKDKQQVVVKASAAPSTGPTVTLVAAASKAKTNGGKKNGDKQKTSNGGSEQPNSQDLSRNQRRKIKKAQAFAKGDAVTAAVISQKLPGYDDSEED